MDYFKLPVKKKSGINIAATSKSSEIDESVSE